MNIETLLQVLTHMLDHGVRPESEIRIKVEDGSQWFTITEAAYGRDTEHPTLFCQPVEEPPTNYYWDDRQRFCRHWGSFDDDPKMVVGHRLRTLGFPNPDENGLWVIQEVEDQALEVEPVDAP